MSQSQHQPQVPQRTRSWGFRIWLAALVAWPVLELWAMWFVVGQIGFWWTLLVMLATALLGGWLMVREGKKSRAALTELRASGRRPEGHLLDAVLILIGGILLLLPGFIGDIVGLLAILPWTRPFVRRAASAVIDSRLRARGIDVTRLRVTAERDTIIPGETVADPGTPPASQPQPDEIVIKGEIEQ